MILPLILTLYLFSYAALGIDIGGEESLDNILRLDTEKHVTWGLKNRLRLEVQSPQNLPDERDVRFYSSLDFYILNGIQNPLETLPYYQDFSIPDSLQSLKDFLDNGFLDISRLYIQIPVYKAEIVFGRQRVPWGQGIYFRPLDFFNKVNPIDLKAEKLGLDGLYATIPISLMSSLEFLIVPNKWPGHSQAGTRAHIHVHTFDIGASYAYRGKDLEGSELNSKPQVMGFDFKGDMGIGIHGEGLYRFYKTYPMDRNETKNRFKASIGADYSFLDGRLLPMIEYFYNGDGSTDYKNYKRSGQFEYLGRDYAVAQILYNPNILISWGLNTLMNLSDKSLVVTPLLDWSIYKRTTLDIAIPVVIGEDGREYDPKVLGRILGRLRLGLRF